MAMSEPSARTSSSRWRRLRNRRPRIDPALRAQRRRQVLGRAQGVTQLLLGERELAHALQRDRLVHADLADERALGGAALGIVEQDLERALVVGEGPSRIAVLQRFGSAGDELRRLAAFGLQILKRLELDDVRERLDRNIEHAGQDT